MANGYNVTGNGNKVTRQRLRLCHELVNMPYVPYWEVELRGWLDNIGPNGYGVKQSRSIKIDGEVIRISESGKLLFEALVKVDKVRAKQIARAYKLAWNAYHFKKLLNPRHQTEFVDMIVRVIKEDCGDIRGGTLS